MTDQTKPTPPPTPRLTFLLVNTFNALPGEAGFVLSRHRSLESALKAEVEMLAAVRRANGPNSYLPLRIFTTSVACPAKSWLKKNCAFPYVGDERV